MDHTEDKEKGENDSEREREREKKLAGYNEEICERRQMKCKRDRDRSGEPGAGLEEACRDVC
jgi:hypothetical protein